MPLVVLDTARIVVVALSLVWMFLLVFAAMSSITRPQRYRMVATALVLSTEAATQFERVGEPADWLTWRLPIVLLACVIGTWATWMFSFRGDGNGHRRRRIRLVGDGG